MLLFLVKINTMKVYNLSLLAFLFTLLVACGGSDGGGEEVKPEDKESPTLVISSPTENQVYGKGATLNILGTAKDNEGLASLMVSVAISEEQPKTSLKGISDPWEPENKTVSLEGTEQSLDFVFGDIDSDIKGGTYIVSYVLTDAAGNETKKQTNIIIQ